MLDCQFSFVLVVTMTLGFVYGENFAIASGVLGSQSLVDSPHGKMVRCSGNLLITPTVCAGTNRNDTIVANLAEGTIYGENGDDKVQGLLGRETVFGNNGNDAIQAGNSSATLFGNDGNDVLVGSVGTNMFFGSGAVFMDGGRGDDHLIGGIDHDVMTGGPGRDNFTCSGKEDLITDYNPNLDSKSGNCVLF